jgi:hypothetical protein
MLLTRNVETSAIKLKKNSVLTSTNSISAIGTIIESKITLLPLPSSRITMIQKTPYDISDDKINFFANLEELGILDDSYDGPKTPWDATSILSSHRQSSNTFG